MAAPAVSGSIAAAGLLYGIQKSIFFKKSTYLALKTIVLAAYASYFDGKQLKYI
jgi:hypothetical protein